MTEVTRYGDITQTTTRCFAEQGIERWTTVNADESGEDAETITQKRSRLEVLGKMLE